MYKAKASRRDLKWLKQALKIAKNSNCRQKHGALVIRGGRVIGWYPNRMRNHPQIVSDPHTDSSTHAEIGALRMASEARGATVYVARLGGHGQALSKPCEACMDALRAAGVKRCVYTTEGGCGVIEY